MRDNKPIHILLAPSVSVKGRKERRGNEKVEGDEEWKEIGYKRHALDTAIHLHTIISFLGHVLKNPTNNEHINNHKGA